MRGLVAASCLAAVALAGCCSHGANQYAYAPPLAPPVYPQPPLPAAPIAAPVVAPVGQVPVLPAAPLVSGAAYDGVVPANADGTCPPCATGGVMPVAYDAAGQSVPCPPGP